MQQPSDRDREPAGGAIVHPERIGDYRILDVLGTGGMGIVYLAEQRDPIRRQVALKLIGLGMDSREVLARFAQERQALALMSHDGIAKIFDCGVGDRGQPYFVMELVTGSPLDRYCDDKRLTVRERIELVVKVCDAIQHAHDKGVVHRDLKPGNVLVRDIGESAQPKIIDFGLAKAMGAKLVEASLYTEVGQLVGTPDYMAPEQADFGHTDVDARADVYAIGVMLYRVLAGVPPFPRASSPLERLRVLREEDPSLPSTAFAAQRDEATAIAAARRSSVSVVQKTLKTGLDRVVMKALHKDRRHRYQSARELARDLQRFLDGQPVEAARPSTWSRRLGRNRWAVLSALTVVVAVTITLLFKGGSDSAAESLVRTERAIERANELMPPWPDRREDLRGWIEDANELLDARAKFDARADALGDDGSEEAATLARLRSQLATLRARVPAMQRAHKWSRSIEDASLHHRGARHSWSDVRDAIRASSRYAGQRIDLSDAHVIGLVPIGENPESKLWEFYDLRSAWDGRTAPSDIPIPEHEWDGRVRVGPETGIVFVLVPGGTDILGSHASDESRNRDPLSRSDERPAEVVELDSYLIARHELTRAQWRRLADDSSPSIDRDSDCLPQTELSWIECADVLQQCGMSLPTESQWEFACRASRDSPWSTGEREESLNGLASVRVAGREGTLRRVDAMWCNAFGLHHAHGNALEWCRDEYVDYRFHRARPIDGLRTAHDSGGRARKRVARGGAFDLPAADARCACRKSLAAGTREPNLGVRPARSISGR